MAALALWLALTQGASVQATLDNSFLPLLVREYVTSFCPSPGFHHPLPELDAGATGFVPDAYDLWVDQVADHIRSGAPFGPDYDDIAERARVQIYNVWFDCAKHVHDLTELEQRATQTPAVVGRRLWQAFASAPPASRAAAAAAFVRSAYPGS